MLTPARFAPLPMRSDALHAYRIAARRQWRPAQIGAHLTRRMGESQEFREHTVYQLGDDVRHVDWRASARIEGRHGLQGSQNWLVRRFSAEEHYNFIISLDTRATMHYPLLPEARRRPAAQISKLQAARWLATALAWIALDGGDRAALHPLFGQRGAGVELRGAPALDGIEERLDRFSASAADDHSLNLDELDGLLKPASVWLILSDLYFPDDVALRLADRMRAAVDGRRWLILVELDSWPYESAVLGAGPRRIAGPIKDNRRLFVTPPKLAEVEARIEDQRKRFLSAAGAGLIRSHWPWPPALRSGDDFAAFFQKTFQADRELRKLFARDPW